MNTTYKFETEEAALERISQMAPEKRVQFEKFTEEIQQIAPDQTHSPKQLLRVFTVAKGDIGSSIKIWKAFHEIWKEANAGGSMEEVFAELDTGKWALGGFDKEGRRIIHFIAKYHDPSQFSMYVSFKTQMIISDLLLDNAESQAKGALFVVWLEGTGWANFNLEAQKYYTKKTEMMGEAASDMMHRCLLIDSPWYIRWVMALIRPFMPKELQEKNHTLTSAQLHEQYPETDIKDIQALKDEIRSRSSFWF